MYALGWKIGTSCPTTTGYTSLGIKIGQAINFGNNLGMITMHSDRTRGDGKGFKATYSFEGK